MLNGINNYFNKINQSQPIDSEKATAKQQNVAFGGLTVAQPQNLEPKLIAPSQNIETKPVDQAHFERAKFAVGEKYGMNDKLTFASSDPRMSKLKEGALGEKRCYIRLE